MRTTEKKLLASVGATELLQEKLNWAQSSDYFQSFDQFLMQKWSDLPEEANRREDAYRHFYHKVRDKGIANRKTIRSWFGLSGYSRAKRNQIFRLAVALHFTPGEAQEYLIQGILEPGFQINDYREMLLMYALEHHLTWERYEDMAFVFIGRIGQDTVLEQTAHTSRLWAMYQQNCRLEPEQFLLWMLENAGMFKGYGRMALHYFQVLKKEILSYIRADAQEQLKSLGMDGKQDEQALRVREELEWIACSSKEKNTDLLAELYASAIEENLKAGSTRRGRYRKREEFNLPEEIFGLSSLLVGKPTFAY